MFWQLLLAHFIADYPLQTNWMVQNKTLVWVLFLHGTIHFTVMLVATLPVSLKAWPYLLALAAIHIGIDIGKNWFTVHRPQRRIGPYLIDQTIHFVSIGLVNAWILSAGYRSSLALSRMAAVAATGFLLVTFVYMVTERIILNEIPAYPAGSQAQIWMRLFTRAGFLGLLLAGWRMLSLSSSGMGLVLPYPSGRAGLRVLLTDLCVTLLIALAVILLNGVIQ